MANWTCSLFYNDLYSKDFIQLADWLEDCRNVVKPEYCIYDIMEFDKLKLIEVEL